MRNRETTPVCGLLFT